VRAERPLARMAARWACMGGVVLLAAVPVYVYVEPPWRALVARLASAVVLGVALLELRRAVADQVAESAPSALDRARDPRGPVPEVPLHLLDLMADVRTALRSRRYFEDSLWPRLVALAPRPLARPPSRRGRGPGLASLRDVMDAMEKPS
jgi:hypothetical protein